VTGLRGDLRHPLALCGDVGGHRRTYFLGPGLNRIGSRLDGDVVLALPGISRRHALLVVEPGRLCLEDLGSKNGTYVNGERLESGRIEVGDRLRFGPVALRLEELSGGDGELAIPLRGEAGAGRAAPETTKALTAASPRWDGGPAWLEAFVEKLPRARDGSVVGSVAEALSFLVHELGAEGAALLEGAGPPVVLCCIGEIPDDVELGEVSARMARGQEGPRSLAVWGELPGRDDPGPLLRLLLRLLDLSLRPEPPPTPAARPRLVVPPGWVRGGSPAMRTLLRQMEAVAASDLPILILGETGVGKEGVARILHASSTRRSGSFVALNCAAIPKDLLEAELFGVGRGVATGVSPRSGQLQAAHGGTLFLDEIGDMPAELQAKLLRVLQEKEVQPLGSAPVAVDVRVLAATNIGIEERIRDGAFRSDLYYRLAGYVLRVPPLRERREDIPLLVEHFLRAAAREAGKSIRGITVAALRRLVERPWPGNVRQLEHWVRRLVWLCDDSETIVAETLDLAGFAEIPAGDGVGEEETGLAGDLELASLERRAVREALRRHGGNQSRAAEALGITRTSLYRRMQRYGLPSGSA